MSLRSGARLRPLVARLGLVGLGLGAGLLLAEVSVRTFNPQIGVGWNPYAMEAYRGIYRLHPIIGYEMLPNIPEREDHYFESRYRFATNRIGLRDRDFDLKPSGYRILGLGDSFTFGLGVETSETYLKRLEVLLRRAAGEGVEVINGGVSGYGTANEYFLLRERLIAYDPHLVVLGFYVGNDLYDNVEFEETKDFLDESGYLRRHLAAEKPTSWWMGTLPVPLKTWLRRYSHVYALGTSRYQDLKIWLGIFPGIVLPRQIELHRVAEPAAVRDAWQRTGMWLGRMAELLNARGKDFVVVVIPTDYQVRAEKWRGLRRFYRLPAEGYSVNRPQEVLRDLCRRRGLKCLDLLPALRAEDGRRGPLYYQMVHWNAAGHGLAAELLAEYLISGGFVVPRPEGRK